MKPLVLQTIQAAKLLRGYQFISGPRRVRQVTARGSMHSVHIVNNLEGQQAHVNGHDVSLKRNEVSEIAVADWLELRTH